MKREKANRSRSGFGSLPGAVGVGILLCIASLILERWLAESVIAALIITVLILWISAELFSHHLKSFRFWVVAGMLLVAHSCAMVMAVLHGWIGLEAHSLMPVLVGGGIAVTAIVNLAMRSKFAPLKRR
jgi:hypothetical protein